MKHNTAICEKNKDYAVCVRNAEIFVFPKHGKQISRSLVLCDLALDNAGS